MEPLAAEFERALRQDVEHVMKVSSYRPSYHLQMLATDGAVATAKKLVLAGSTHEGFARLWELALLDRSIEAAMIRPEFSQLFTADEVEAARSSLCARTASVSAHDEGPLSKEQAFMRDDPAGQSTAPQHPGLVACPVISSWVASRRQHVRKSYPARRVD